MATTLNCKKRNRWGTNSKAFAQTMKTYGGLHMHDLFQLSFVGPSFKMTKQVNNNGVQFVLGEHVTIFKCVS
jgi:hypothetical protein